MAVQGLRPLHLVFRLEAMYASGGDFEDKYLRLRDENKRLKTQAHEQDDDLRR